MWTIRDRASHCNILIETSKVSPKPDESARIAGMRNASERLADEYNGYASEKTAAEQQIRRLLARDPNADTANLTQVIADLDQKISECREQAKKLGTALY